MNIKKAGTFAAGFVVGIIFLYAWGQIFDKDSEMSEIEMHDDAEMVVESTEMEDGAEGVMQDTDMSTAVTTSEAIVVESQAAGSSVVVKSVNLEVGENGGWIVVHEVKDDVMANALGAVRRDSGVSTDVVVKLLRATVAGGTYGVVLYSDDGDRAFSMTTDKPLKDAQGEYVMSTFSTQ